MKKLLSVTLFIPLLALTLACPTSSTSQKLATASDAVAHGLLNAQTAARQAVASGVITQSDETEFEGYLIKASTAGTDLDAAIRQNQSAATISAKVNAFLDAFNALQSAGLVGIKNPNLKLTLSTIITGAETSVAVIQATIGGK